MQHYIHSALILTAVKVNWKDRHGMALSLIVGLTLVVPFNLFTHRSNFYIVCAMSDLAVGLIAVWLNTRMSNFILVVCAYMCASHITGMWYGGANPDSPYRWLMKALEYAEIASCSIFPLLPDRRKHASEEGMLSSGRGYRKE